MSGHQIFTLIILIIWGFCIWAVHPRFSRRKSCLELARWNYAHRGLWNMNLGIPENSLPAFREAVKYHFAIELDVHLTADRKMVVFHDDTLSRMCQIDRIVESMTWEELSECRLLGTECTIPLLADVLDIIGGKVPVLIELKLPSKDTSLCPLLYDLLSTYPGPFLIESFNPLGLFWFRRKHPEILRGQLAARYSSADKIAPFWKYCSTYLLVNLVSRPDFIAYNYRHYGGYGCRLNHGLYHTPFWVWTVRSENTLRNCRQKYQAVIFESFIPVHTTEDATED